MIKVTGERAVRETTAQYIHKGEDGKETTSEIRVLYYSNTTGRMKQQWQEAKKKQAEAAKRSKGKKTAEIDPDELEISWHTDTLVEELFELPDLGDADGNPFAITVENLDKIDIRNINAIRKVIADDIAAKKSQPAA